MPSILNDEMQNQETEEYIMNQIETEASDIIDDHLDSDAEDSILNDDDEENQQSGDKSETNIQNNADEQFSCTNIEPMETNGLHKDGPLVPEKYTNSQTKPNEHGEKSEYVQKTHAKEVIVPLPIKEEPTVPLPIKEETIENDKLDTEISNGTSIEVPRKPLKENTIGLSQVQLNFIEDLEVLNDLSIENETDLLNISMSRDVAATEDREAQNIKKLKKASKENSDVTKEVEENSNEEVNKENYMVVINDNSNINKTDQDKNNSENEMLIDEDENADENKKSKRSLSVRNINELITKKPKLVDRLCQEDVPQSQNFESQETPNLHTLALSKNIAESRKITKKLSRSDLEEISIKKVLEVLALKQIESEMQQTVKSQAELLEVLSKQILRLKKQHKDLLTVHKKLSADLKTHKKTDQPVVPLKITRSVGLQVTLTPGNKSSNNRINQAATVGQAPGNMQIDHTPKQQTQKPKQVVAKKKSSNPNQKPAEIFKIPATPGFIDLTGGDDRLAEKSAADVTEKSAADVAQKSATDVPQKSANDVAQKSVADVGQKSAAVEQESAEIFKKPATPGFIDLTGGDDRLAQKSAVDVIQKSAANVLQKSATDVTQKSANDVAQKSVADVAQKSAAVEQKLATDVTQKSATDVVQKSAADVVQKSAANDGAQLRTVPATPELIDLTGGDDRLVQKSAADMAQKSATDVVQKSATDVTQKSATDVTQKSATDVIQKSATDVVQKSAANDGAQLRTVPATPELIDLTGGDDRLVQKSAADMAQKSATYVVQKSATDVTQKSATDVTQKSATDVTQKSATDVVQKSAANGAQLRTVLAPNNRDAINNNNKDKPSSEESLHNQNKPPNQQDISLTATGSTKMLYKLPTKASDSTGQQKDTLLQLKPSNTINDGSRMPSQNSTVTNTAKHPAPLPPTKPKYSNPNLKPTLPQPKLTIRKLGDGVILQWKMEYNLNLYEKIGSYQLYAYQDTTSLPSTDMWNKVGDMKALPLPMACTLTHFVTDNKYYFAVRAVDVLGRVGTFSDPQEISL